MRYTVLVFSLLLISSPRIARAQSNDARVEIGALVGAIDFRESVHEKPLALGLRAGYRVNTVFGLEGEWIKCPGNGAGNFEQVLVLAGVKAGPHFGPISVLGRLRAGAIRFGSSGFIAQNGRARTAPAIDVGAIIELRTSPRVALRIDMGRLIVPFGSNAVRGPVPPHSRELGTTINPQGAFGLQFSF